MKTWKITNDIIDLASKWNDFNGNQFSIRKDGVNRSIGNIAEIIFSRTYPDAIRISNIDKNADFILKGKRIDVKCKERSVYCKDFYEVSIEERQIDFDVDWYAFYSYNNKESVLEFLGWISKKEFIDKSRMLISGQIDCNNGWIVNVDCRNLKINELINV
jgi:hypothetical protein